MKLYHISQSENRGYDTYSDLVVCAESEEEAANIHPQAHYADYDEDPWKKRYSGWCSSPEQVKVKYIGEAASHIEKGIVCASFHAG